MEVNWEAIAAVGQCIGAFATFTAVVVALRQNRPKVKVTTKVCDWFSVSSIPGVKSLKVAEERLHITAVNIGNVPVQITSLELKLPKKEKKNAYIVPQPNTVPKVLMPAEEVSIWTDARVWRNKGIKDFYFACAYDSANRVYFVMCLYIKESRGFSGGNLEK